MEEADGNSDIKVSADEKWGRQSVPVAVPPTSQITNTDDSIRLSNSADASAEAHAYAEDDQCDGRTMHTVTLPDGTESKPFVCAHITRKGDGNNAGQLPTTREILYYAATTIHADGAGLHKRPEGVSYTNKYIPTLVAATHPTQTHTVTLLGHDITVTLTATSYTWSWGDGTPDLTTTSPGMPWQEGMDPNTDPALIRHYYKAPNGWKSFLDGPYPYATRTITLTTTWAGTATNPFTGETQTINGLVTTTEITGPFPLGQLIVNNTDTSEEKQGH
ncbi:hypothetical protein O3654_05165 [Pauljensenia sp. 20925_1_91]